MKDHSEITTYVLNDIEDHINNELENPEPGKWENGKYTGPYQRKVYTAKIHGETGDYKVALEFVLNGDVYLDTAYKRTKKQKMKAPRGFRLTKVRMQCRMVTSLLFLSEAYRIL